MLWSAWKTKNIHLLLYKIPSYIFICLTSQTVGHGVKYMGKVSLSTFHGGGN